MNLVIPLLLFSFVGDPSNHGRDAQSIFAASFEHNQDPKKDEDVNYDGWPDRWKRQRGKGLPQYLKIGIGGNGGNRFLEINLNGGGASLVSPTVRVSAMSGYVLDAKIRTQGLRRDYAYAELLLMDMNGNTLETHRSRRVTGTGGWQNLRVGPLNFDDNRIYKAAIRLSVRPTDEPDLKGKVMFDDIHLSRLPRMTLLCNSALNLITDPANARITCVVSGISSGERTLEFELLDVFDRVIATSHHKFSKSSNESAVLNRTIHWQPKLVNGYFRVRAWLAAGDNSKPLKRVLPICVIDKRKVIPNGEFGWALPDGNKPLTTRQLVPLLTNSGISQLKFPVWNESNSTDWSERLSQFASDMLDNNIRMIGILDQPPNAMRKKFDPMNKRLPVASIFLDKRLWGPLVDPVMTHLSLKINRWQLGRDEDDSFVGFPGLPKKLAEIKKHLDRFGQEIELGLGWHWLHETPTQPLTGRTPWQFMTFRVDKPLTPEELLVHLQGSKPGGPATFVSIRPLDRGEYTLRQRVIDFVRRMIAAHRGGAKAIFVSDPYHPDHGLVTRSGHPNEMFLPWRNVALAISGTKYVGSIRMPSGSHNHIFDAGGGESVMVVWNERPTKEVIFLGTTLKIEDVWGKRLPTRIQPAANQRDFDRQIIPVGPMPTIVRGVNTAIARWRMSFRFPNEQLDSIFGREQTVHYEFKNRFDQGLGGSISVETPWEDTENSQHHFKVARNNVAKHSFQVTLKSNATSGPQPLRVNFEVTADRKYMFSVYRDLVVGSKDIKVDLITSLNEDGDLVVEQHMTNLTNQFVSFTCTVFVNGRKRIRKRVIGLARGRITLPFVFQNGEELIGERISLRAEEINGARVLNFHVKAER